MDAKCPGCGMLTVNPHTGHGMEPTQAVPTFGGQTVEEIAAEPKKGLAALAELRARAKELGLKTSGKADELRARIAEAEAE